MVTALAGPSEAGTFPVDLCTDRTTVAHTERIPPHPIIELDDVAPLPEFLLYPLPDQVADKVCTMHGRYGPQHGPSTRCHDLVDLVRILRGCQLDAAQTRTAIRMQEERRRLTVPATLTTPGEFWSDGYRACAQNSSLPRPCTSWMTPSPQWEHSLASCLPAALQRGSGTPRPSVGVSEAQVIRVR